MPAAETARLIASLELQDKNFTRGLKQVERGVGRVDKKLGAFSGAINRTAIRAIDSLVARAADVPGAVISAAVEQESAITGIAKTINGDISDIVDDLKRLSTETGSTFTELAGIAELGGAMGIAKDDVAAFTEQVAILGATTDVTVEDAATALGQLQNVIGLTGDEFDNFAASLVDLGNKGASTESQILEIAKRSGGAAKLFGIAKDETLGWASAVANLGLQEELAGTGLQNLFIKSMPAFIKGNKTLQSVTGKTAKELKRAWEEDASGALQGFIADLSELSEGDRLAAIQKLYGKGSGLTRILLGLTGDTDNLTDSLNIGTKAWEDATAAQAEADKRFATSEFAFKRLNNTVNLAAATIGTELLPVLVDLAEEGMAWLNEPATQKALKTFAVDLGKGVRGLAGIITSVDWGSIAGFLGTAAGFAGQLVTWFAKMPGWAQAFLVGGFVATKLPIVGDILSEAAKGLIKGVLGINAGVVNVNGPVAGMGGAAGGAAAGAGKVARIANAVKILGAVTIAGASIALLAQQIGTFVEGVGRDQQALQEKVNATTRQGFKATVANLEATSAGLAKLSGLDEILASVTGGGQITENFEMAADRIVKAQGLTRTDTLAALRALSAAQKQARELNLKTPGLDASIVTLTNRLNAEQQSTTNAINNAKSIASRENDATRTRVEQVAVKAQATANAVKNAQSIASRENSAQKAELANIKNVTVTGDAQQKAAIIAQTAVTAVGNMLSIGQSMSQVLAAGSTTSAVNVNAAATRGVAPPITSAIYSIGASIRAAIFAARPVIQSTNVVNNYTRTQRTGATSGSRNGTSYSGYR
jgi:TP901 family phage tail tape measure protein